MSRPALPPSHEVMTEHVNRIRTRFVDDELAAIRLHREAGCPFAGELRISPCGECFAVACTEADCPDRNVLVVILRSHCGACGGAA